MQAFLHVKRLGRESWVQPFRFDDGGPELQFKGFQQAKLQEGLEWGGGGGVRYILVCFFCKKL